jgi:hypothetical protein
MMRAELPYDETFWRSGADAPGDPVPGPGSVRPDALLVELGAAPTIAGGAETDERLADTYGRLAEAP